MFEEDINEWIEEIFEETYTVERNRTKKKSIKERLCEEEPEAKGFNIEDSERRREY